MMERLDDFLHQRLRVDLEHKLLKRSELAKKKEGFESLQENLEKIQKTNLSKFVSRVDLGSGVSMEAEVEDPSRLFVDVGLGFHVECNLDEAKSIAQSREIFYQELLDVCEMEIGNVKAHIQLVMHALSVTKGSVNQTG